VSDWIEHDGNGRPHPASTYVEVQLRDGRVESGCSAFLSWPWVNDEYDVLRWREIPEPPSKDAIIAELVEALAGLLAETELPYASQLRDKQDAARAALAKARGQ
jgi:hypothetical protein